MLESLNAGAAGMQSAVMQNDQNRIHEKAAILNKALSGESSGTQLSASEMKKIEEAAKEFEAVFLGEMVKPMFEGVKSDPMFGGGHAEEVYKGMMVQEYGKVMADAGGLGLADHVKAELLRIQEEAKLRNELMK